MKPTWALGLTLAVIGFLTGSTLHYYRQTQNYKNPQTKTGEVVFQANLPQNSNEIDKKVDELTVPAEPRGRVTYPANVYVVNTKETLFAIGSKLGIPWQIIQQANNLANENSLQAGNKLAIPKLSGETDNYRINFKLDEKQASVINHDLRDKDSDALFSPVETAKLSAVGYFEINDDDNFQLKQADLSNGTATVEVKVKSGARRIVGLIQPKTKGDKGFWAVWYVERYD